MAKTYTWPPVTQGKMKTICIHMASYNFLFVVIGSFVSWLVFESGSHHVTQAGLKFEILPQLPECWNYRHVPPGPALPFLMNCSKTEEGYVQNLKMESEQFGCEYFNL
jgi:hypothetical protein